MKRRADVQRHVQILSKLSGFALNPKMPAGTKKNGVPCGTPFLLNNRADGSVRATGLEHGPMRHGDVARLGAYNHQNNQGRRDDPDHQHQ
jgi:hypothetical protein